MSGAICTHGKRGQSQGWRGAPHVKRSTAKRQRKEVRQALAAGREICDTRSRGYVD